LAWYSMEMDQTAAAAIDKQYATIDDLLRATLKPKRFLGSGDNAKVYRFPKGLGLDDFVVRIAHGFRNRFLSSTALSTLPEILVGVNVGQPLLYHGKDTDLYDLGILLRFDGIALPKVAGGKTAADRCKNLYATLQIIIRKTGKNPFVDILQQAISLEKAGYDPDLKIDNIMVKDDLSGLGLIDQLHCQNSDPVEKTYLPGLLSIWERQLSLAIEVYLSTHGIVTNDPASDKIQALILQAGREILRGFLVNGNEFIKPASFEASEQASAFGTVTSTHAISLSDPPHVLVEHLREHKAFALNEQLAR